MLMFQDAGDLLTHPRFTQAGLHIFEEAEEPTLFGYILRD